jgi:3-hydroxypropanoate dehydrogenase
MEMNRAKILAAPMTVIIGNDLDFATNLPTLFPAHAEVLQAFKQPMTC